MSTVTSGSLGNGTSRDCGMGQVEIVESGRLNSCICMFVENNIECIKYIYLEYHAFSLFFFFFYTHVSSNKEKKKKTLARDCLEDIKRIGRRADNHPRDLGMPMQLLDILLSLVNKE